MIGVVLISHGQLANELLRAAEIIVGKIENTVTVDIHPKTGMEEIHTAVEAAIRTVDAGKGVLLLIDMFGGTPSNIGLSFLATHKVEVVTGVNLPMLIKLATLREEKSLTDLASYIKDYGRRNISVAREILPEGDL